MNTAMQLMQMLKPSDDLLAQIIPTLQQIRDKELTLPTSQPLEDMLEILKYQHNATFEIFTLTYPNDGTLGSIASGDTILNYRAGTVKAPAGTITRMSSNLMDMKKEFMRSVVINADEDIVIQLDDKDKMPVKADSWHVLTFQQFQELIITTTTTTNVFVSACTNPQNLHDVMQETLPNSVGDGRTVVATAGTRVVLASSTRIKEVTITAETNNTDIIVVGSVTCVAALTTRRGTPLYPGDSVTFQSNNLADFYLDSIVSTEGVTYTYLA